MSTTTPTNLPPQAGSSATPSVRDALLSLGRRPAFVAVFAILLVAAVGLNAATSFLQLHFRKQPVPLQKPVAALPKQLGPWTQVSLDMPLSGDIQEVLGTDKYIFRDFIDTRVVPAGRVAEFEGKDFRQREFLLYGKPAVHDAAGNLIEPARTGIMQDYPKAVIRLSVTYYTGLVDTVAHIPDRCFVADGFQPTDYTTPRWQLPGFQVDDDGWRLGGDGKRLMAVGSAGEGSHEDTGLPVRFINFEDQDNGRGNTRSRNVTYFFQVNGRYDANPLGVRKTLQDLFQKHGYYAKVELLTLLNDRQECERVQRDFLSNAMPALEQILPDWKATVTGTASAGGPSTRPATPAPSAAAPGPVSPSLTNATAAANVSPR